MTRSMPSIASAALALFALPTAAHGYAVNLSSGGNVVRWEVPEVPYYLQLACSDDLEQGECLDAIRAGFDSWVAVDCATIGFEELGDAPNPKANLLAGAAPNGKNELVFLEDASWTYGKNVLGVTAPLQNASGFITEADIAFNGYLQKWSVTGGKGTVDLESVAVHEIGHMIGIQHNLDFTDWHQPPTMAPNIASQQKSRTLEADDEMAACFLYPVGDTFTCESDETCPNIMSRNAQGDEYYSGRMTCSAETGTCSDIAWVKSGIANMGEACEVSENCVGDFYCQPWQQAGGSVCAQFCLSAAPDCPAGFTCRPFQNQPKYGACLPESGVILAPGEGPLGCTTSEVCTDGKLCLPTPLGDKKSCTTVCQIDDPASCPDGYECHQYSLDKPTGGCFPPAPVEPDPDPELGDGPDAGPTEDGAGGDDLGPTPDARGEADAVAGDAAGRAGAAGDGCVGGGAGPVGALGWAVAVLGAVALGSRRRAR